MTTIFLPAGSEDATPWGRHVLLAGIVLLCALSGAAVAVIETNALYLCMALIGCLFILHDFRIGVVLLILLMPLASSTVFPREMFGITGLNPMNLLLIGTLGSCLLQGLVDGSIRRFVPRPLLWLYVVPIVAAGAMGSRHVGEIAAGFSLYGLLSFDNVTGYLRDVVARPLFFVIFALLIAAAVARTGKPEKFLAPTLISIWIMSLLAIGLVLQSGAGLGQLAGDDSRAFLSPLGMHANDLGRLYAVAYALLLFTWAESRDTGLRLVLLVSMAVVVVALILTFSRGAFLGFIVVSVLFVLWRFSPKTLMLAAGVAAVVLFALPDAVYDRIASGYGKGWNAISAGRIDEIWLPLLPDFLRSPVFGNGLASILWSEAMRTAGGITVLGVTQAHNAYLETLLDMGVMGLALLSAYFAHVWKQFRALSADPAASPEQRGLFQGAAAGLVGFLVAGIAGSHLTPKPEQFFLWLAIGMMYGQGAWEKSVTSPSRQEGPAEARTQSA